MKEYAIGERFIDEKIGEELEVVERTGCDVCVFFPCRVVGRRYECRASRRNDKTSVQFRKVEQKGFSVEDSRKAAAARLALGDPVKHPSHYIDRVPGVECIQVTQHFNFNCGNAIKYVWRHGLKGDAVQDLEKARQYIDFEIKRIQEERERK